MRHRGAPERRRYAPAVATILTSTSGLAAIIRSGSLRQTAAIFDITTRRSSGSVMGLASAARSAVMLRLKWKVNRGSATRFAYQSRRPGRAFAACYSRRSSQFTALRINFCIMGWPSASGVWPGAR